MGQSETVGGGESMNMNPETLTFVEYQKASMDTAIYPGKGSLEGLSYCVLGLVGEAGEVANKLKKVLRDDGGKLYGGRRVEIISELGDVLWNLQQSLTELEADLGHVAVQNRLKLRNRAAAGTLDGSGDIR